MKKTIWDEMRRMQRRMNRFWKGYDEDPWEMDEEDLSGYRKAWIDARESEKEFIIAVELPGVDKKDIEVNVEDGALVIKVEKKSSEKEKTEDSYRYEASYAGFYRRVPLPENADAEKIDAEYKEGVLKLKIPKLGERKRKGKSVSIR